MPIYEYKCSKCKKEFEVMQRITADPLTRCEACGGKLDKLISQSAFILKGTGWYQTDFAGKKPSSEEREANAGEANAGEANAGEAKSGEAKSGEAKSGETKSGETKSGEAKSGETKFGEAKSGETKSGDGKPKENKTI